MYDRYIVHHARAAVDWFENHGEKIEILPLPGSFGDIMPLEKTWNDIIKHLRDGSKIIEKQDQLWNEIENIWNDKFDNKYVKDT